MEPTPAAAAVVAAKPCCGVYVQQINRIARLSAQIQA